MRISAINAWTRIGLDAWTLAIDANAVIAMRLAKMAAGGPGASSEAQLMVSEKIKAAAQLQTALMTGKFGSTPIGVAKKSLNHYSTKVKANKRRLDVR